MVVCLLGALPYLFAGTFSSLVNACFESTSGFTTTGATVIQDLEILPKGILFWRSLTHWLGGMGIILLSMAILPMLGVGGMQLYRAEVPGPVPDRLKPRIRETAKTLWMVYVLISVLEVGFLLVGGMSLFDAVCHTFGTMATGGFSTHNASISHYGSAYIDGVITFFMFAAGANFALHYQLLRGNPRRYLQDPEFRFYLFSILFITGGVSLLLWGGSYDTGTASFRYAVFQVTSILTTTGYVTADYEQWSLAAQYILFALMFFGGCAGSTGGSVKCIRILLLLKQAYKEIYSPDPSACRLHDQARQENRAAGGDGECAQFLAGLSGHLRGGLPVDVLARARFQERPVLGGCLYRERGPRLGRRRPGEDLLAHRTDRQVDSDLLHDSGPVGDFYPPDSVPSAVLEEVEGFKEVEGRMILKLILVLLALFGVYVWLGGFWRRRFSFEPGYETIHFVGTRDGWRIALYHYPAASHRYETPILLCHGLGANRFNFDLGPEVSLARYLQQEGFDVWSIDLRGRGLSGRCARGERCSGNTSCLR